MKKIETLVGLLILIVGAGGVFLLFHNKPSAVEEEGTTEEATVVPVQVGSIQRTTLHGYVYAYGMVEFEKPGKETPAGSVNITAAASGIITGANCVEGQQVNKDDILFHIDSRLADIAVQKAQSARDLRKKEFERQKKLKEFEGTSEKDFAKASQDLELAQKELASAMVNRKLLDVTAPISGVVFHIQTKAGESVNTSQILAELYDIHRLMITLKVPSREVSLLKLGQKVEINYNQAAGENTGKGMVSGTISYIESEIDTQTDAITVRVLIPEDSGLRPSQFVNTRIIYDVHQNCLVVPEDSAVTDPNGQTYIALVKDDTATRKNVRILLKESGLQEIQAEGLEEGMKVVTAGAYGLPDQTKVQIINR